eukprot:364268-Chlamydomonas_euryale.AAC.17
MLFGHYRRLAHSIHLIGEARSVMIGSVRLWWARVLRLAHRAAKSHVRPAPLAGLMNQKSSSRSACMGLGQLFEDEEDLDAHTLSARPSQRVAWQGYL